jgi:uncharacterized protein YjcR
MENKELNELRNTKPHNDKEFLSKLWNEGYTVAKIASYLNISVKLVHIKLREHGLV